MSNPVVCHYKCPECRKYFWSHKPKPVIYSSFAAKCPHCKCRDIRPYKKEWPGSDTYSLPDVGLGG